MMQISGSANLLVTSRQTVRSDIAPSVNSITISGPGTTT